MVGNAALLASTATGRVGLLEVQAASNAMAGRARRAKVLVFKERLRKGVPLKSTLGVR
jgi:hypothetical protein